MKQVRSDKFNIMAEAFVEKDSQRIFWTIERWSDKAAYDNASQTKSLNELNSISSAVVRKPKSVTTVTDLEPFPAKDWNKQNIGNNNALVIMLFVDAKPGTEDHFKDVYHTAMPLFRSEPGVINYQLSQFTSDKTKFVTYEEFKDEAAFQYHLNFPPIQPVINYLNTSIQRQPFQIGLHRLVKLTNTNN